MTSLIERIRAFEYQFKIGSELGFAVSVAVAVAVLPIIVGADAEAILADPMTLLRALGGAAARAAVAGVLLTGKSLLERFLRGRQ